MAILITLLSTLLALPSFATERDGSALPKLMVSAFDWKAWERLTQQEKERNVLWKNKTHPDHCDPIREYREMINFFRIQKAEVNPSEAVARQLAGEVSKGCDGAAQRFVKTFLFLKKSGVDITRSLEYGIEFSRTDDETVENFFELFKRTYLGEYFDLDYTSALRISFDLSKLYKGNRTRAREDFLEISRFCLQKNGLNLPMTQCLELSVRLSRLSQYYPDGIKGDFFKLYRMLREDRRFGVSIQIALRIINEVLPYGPMAVSNFMRSYEYAIDPTGLASGGVEAVKFAIAMAKRSIKQWPPPIYTPPKFIEANTNIHSGYSSGSEYPSDRYQRATQTEGQDKHP